MRSIILLLLGLSFFNSANVAHATSEGSELESIRVLVVPGHDTKNTGGRFKDILEESLARELAGHIITRLSLDDRFHTISARDIESGAYAGFLSDFFIKKVDEVNAFIRAHKTVPIEPKSKKTSTGVTIYHGKSAPSIVQYRLFAINKWAADNNIDVVLHVHLNEYPRSGWSARIPGKYSGVAIYIPPKQSAISERSEELASAILKYLNVIAPTSNLKQEEEGIIHDGKLIATFGRASASVPVALIEYGYLYEPQIENKTLRPLYFEALAEQTVSGIIEFSKGEEMKTVFGSAKTRLATPLIHGAHNEAVLALQLSLAANGFYPPKGKTVRDCPTSGSYRTCTVSAVKEFQTAFGMSTTGIFTAETRSMLLKD